MMKGDRERLSDGGSTKPAPSPSERARSAKARRASKIASKPREYPEPAR
jgi:hypothetical protein